MFSVFLSSYKNASESLGEREMLWGHEPLGSLGECFHSFFALIISFVRFLYSLVRIPVDRVLIQNSMKPIPLGSITRGPMNWKATTNHLADISGSLLKIND